MVSLTDFGNAADHPGRAHTYVFRGAERSLDAGIAEQVTHDLSQVGADSGRAPRPRRLLYLAEYHPFADALAERARRRGGVTGFLKKRAP